MGKISVNSKPKTNKIFISSTWNQTQPSGKWLVPTNALNGGSQTHLIPISPTEVNSYWLSDKQNIRYFIEGVVGHESL